MPRAASFLRRGTCTLLSRTLTSLYAEASLPNLPAWVIRSATSWSIRCACSTGRPCSLRPSYPPLNHGRSCVATSERRAAARAEPATDARPVPVAGAVARLALTRLRAPADRSSERGLASGDRSAPFAPEGAFGGAVDLAGFALISKTQAKQVKQQTTSV